MEKNEISKQLDDVNVKIVETRKTLDEKAADCVKNGDSLSDDLDLLRQSGELDELFLTEQKLRKMLDDFGGNDEIPD